MRAVVVGSLNMDLVLGVPVLPSRGQTLLSRSRERSPGGKGANQAVALARLGSGVAMVGAVGVDPDGAELLAALEAAGVSTRHVSRRPRDPTGLAVVCVTPDGDNAIVVASGANATLAPGDLAAAVPALSGAGLLLLQLEVRHQVRSMLEPEVRVVPSWGTGAITVTGVAVRPAAEKDCGHRATWC